MKKYGVHSEHSERPCPPPPPMRYFLKVRPGAKQEKIEQIDEKTFSVWIREPAKENRANFAVLEAMARYFKVGISRVRFVSGVRSREKVVEVV